MTTRRQFLSAAVGSTALVGLAPRVPDFLLAACDPAIAAKSDKILVVIQLSGGNDGINTVIPYADSNYYKNRFTLAIGKSQVLKINKECGFHPSMQGFAKLLEENKIAICNGVGYPNPNRSHFESMDLWHTAHQGGGSGWGSRMIRTNNQIPTGWLGRYFDSKAAVLAKEKTGDVLGLHLGTEQQPLALAGERVQVPTVRSLEQFRLKLNNRKQLKNLVTANAQARRDGDNELLSFVQSNTVSAIQTSDRVEQILGKYKSKANYPQTGLGRKLSTVAQLIGSDLKTNVYYVTLDGFDTHANQAASHAGLLGQLSEAVAAFMKDLKEQGNDKRTLAFVFSEFGRRLRENASHGTDHGAAAPAFLIGGDVKAGALNDYPSLTDLQDGDLKHSIDYRQIYATILEDWFETKSKPILGKKYKTLDVIG